MALANSLYPRQLPTFETHRNLLDDVDAEHVNYIQRELTGVTQTLGRNPQQYSRVVAQPGTTTPASATQDYGSVALRLDAIEAIARASRFAGEIVMTATKAETAPAGWLFCWGQSYDPAVYPDLYDAIGTSKVPDLRGAVPRGRSGLENVGYLGYRRGADKITLTADQVPQHRHGIHSTASDGATFAGFGLVQSVWYANRVLVQKDMDSPADTGTNYNFTGLGGSTPNPVDITPTNVVVNFMIRAVSGV